MRLSIHDCKHPVNLFSTISIMAPKKSTKKRAPRSKRVRKARKSTKKAAKKPKAPKKAAKKTKKIAKVCGF